MTVTVTSTDTSVPPTARDRGPSWIGLLSVGAASLGWGLFLGMMFLKPKSELPSSGAVGTDRPPARSPQLATAPDPPDNAEQLIKRADFLLQFGNIAEAIELYQTAMPRFELGRRGWLTYRLAISQELIGDAEEAMRWYQQLHLEQSEPVTKMLAEASRARVMMRSGRVRDSQRLLRGVESDPCFRQVPSALQRLVGHLMAQAYAIEVAESLPPSWTWRPVPSARSTPSSLLQQFLDPPSTTDSEVPSTHFEVTVQLGTFAEQTYVSCYLPSVRLDEVVAQLAAALGVPLQVTERAAQRLASRVQHVALNETSVALALDAVLDPVDLMWQQEQPGELSVLATEEATADAVRPWQIHLARRAITQALLRAPEHELALDTKFLQANVEVAAEQKEAARSIYEDVLQKSSTADLNAWWFNYADVLFQLGRRSSAVDAYYHVVDRAGRAPTTAIAYLRIGQILLDDGRYEESLRPLIRGVSLAAADDVRAAASLSLATAYLLIDNPRAAHTALLEARPALRRSDYRYQGNLLEALCRDRISHDVSESGRIRRDLFSAVSRVVPGELVTDVGWLLLGNAYQRLGLTGEVQRLFELSRQQPLTPHVVAEIEERLVQQYISMYALQKATALLQPRLNDSDPRAAMAARLHWAHILLIQERAPDCIQVCREALFLDPTDSEKSRVLQLMGKAFQFQRQFDQAALCFAGLLPAAGDHR